MIGRHFSGRSASFPRGIGAEGYARLVRTAAARERFGRSMEGSLIERALGGWSQATEGAAIRSAPDQELAQGFLRFLLETQVRLRPRTGAKQGRVRIRSELAGRRLAWIDPG